MGLGAAREVLISEFQIGPGSRIKPYCANPYEDLCSRDHQRPTSLGVLEGAMRRIWAVTLAVSMSLIAIHAHPPAASACTSGGATQRWGATATSGSGTNTGTKATFTSWHSWSVPSPSGFSDEAVWTINSSTGKALEGGFFTGLGSNVAWTNGMMPYYTTDNGANEYDYASHYLAIDTSYSMSVQPAINGNNAIVKVGPWTLPTPGAYTVTTPRVNYMQGEVNNTCAWLGGGTGQFFYMYYQPASSYPNNWSSWGSMNSTLIDCPSHGYVKQQFSASTWSNGGYGCG